MADMQSQPIPPASAPHPGALHPELDALDHLRKAVRDVDSAKTLPDPQASLRTRVMKVGARAEKVQRAACAACEALDTISAMTDTLRFALEAAREAGSNRTLPASMIDALQKQVDLAVSCLDCRAREASFGKDRLFCGGSAIEIGNHSLPLPPLSASRIGGNWVLPSAAFTSPTVEYSQSVASVSSGGPNSLEHWADGAALALEAGVTQLQSLHDTIDAFYSHTVLPAVSDLAVALSNTIAGISSGESLDEATALLDDLRRELKSTALPCAPTDSKGVLRLLE